MQNPKDLINYILSQQEINCEVRGCEILILFIKKLINIFNLKTD